MLTDKVQEWRGPTDDLLQVAQDGRVPRSEPAPTAAVQPGDALRFVDFTQSDDREINLEGPPDLTIALKIASLIERDRALGCGALDGERLYLLFRTPRGERPGRVLVGERAVVEALVLQQYDHAITKAELKLILQTLAGLSLQISAVRDRVSIETKKSQSKSMLSKLGYPDLGHLRAVLLASLVAQIEDRPLEGGDG